MSKTLEFRIVDYNEETVSKTKSYKDLDFDYQGFKNETI
jgi:hypothetical protein